MCSSLPHFDAVTSMVDIEDHFAGSHGSSVREALDQLAKYETLKQNILDEMVAWW